MSKKVITIIIAVLLLFSATACGSSRNTQNSQNGYKTNVVRMAQRRVSTYSIAVDLIMQEKKLFEKYLPSDVTVELIPIPASTDQRDALVADQIDIGCFSSAIFIAAVENDLPLVALSDTCLSKFHLYVNKSAPKTLADLENLEPGQKISCSTTLGNSAHMAFLAACKDIFGDAHKFDSYMIGISLEDMLVSMKTSDEIAAALTIYPFGQEAEVFEMAEPILDLTPYAEEYSMGAFYVTSQKFHDENPELIDAYLKAQRETLELVRDKPDEAAESLQKYWDTYSIEEIKKLFLEMPMRMEISESGYDKLAAFMYELELIPNQPKKFSELPNYDSISKIK